MNQNDPWVDKWVSGDVTLYLGDCLNVLPTLEYVDLIIVDIPYNQVNRQSGGLRQFDKESADNTHVDIHKLIQWIVYLAPQSTYVWCATEQCSLLREGFVACGLTTRHCIWEKTNPAPTNGQYLWLSSIENCIFARKSKATFNRFCASPVWRGPTERIKDFPCPKPVWLITEQIDASTNKGDIVCDFMMGSGTTGVASVQTGRRFIGVEIAEKYFDIAVKRIELAQREMVQDSFIMSEIGRD